MEPRLNANGYRPTIPRVRYSEVMVSRIIFRLEVSRSRVSRVSFRFRRVRVRIRFRVKFSASSE